MSNEILPHYNWAERIKKSKIKQADIAKALGVSRISVNNWVRMRFMPSQKHILQVEDYLRQFKA